MYLNLMTSKTSDRIYFTRVFPFDAALYFYSTTYQRETMYFLLCYFADSDFTQKTWDDFIKHDALLQIKLPNSI